MGSLFINAGLAAGVALAAVPVLLHLFMRQTPKHIIFPALRLIRERNKRTRKRLRVKNWLLLLARMAVLALMALALARPRIDAQASVGDGDVPTAMALVFDTSLSMRYKQNDRTRLDEAKERARELLKRAHAASRVFVIDAGDPGVPAGSTPAAAQKRIDTLGYRAAYRPLNEAVAQAYAAVAPTDLPRREVYVLTDMARSAWRTDQAVALPADLKAAKGRKADTFVIRLAPKEVRDAAVVAAEPAASALTQDEPASIRARVRGAGPAAQRVAELWVDDTKRDEKPVAIPAGGEVELPPFLVRLPAGLHRAEVHLAGADPFDDDDRRYLTLDVRPPMPVLVISDRNADANFVAFALEAGETRPYKVTRALTSNLARSLQGRRLGEFACIFVLNCRRLPEEFWDRLRAYVHEGGGLVVAVGDQVDPAAYNDGPAAALLPASLGEVRAVREAFFTFGKADPAHPLFERETNDLLADLARSPIYKTIVATPAREGRAILSYQDGSPALLERIVPGPRPGRVLLWTTALARDPNPSSARAWNDFPVAGWAFVALMNETVPYVAGISGQKLIAEAGEDVVLNLDPTRNLTGFALRRLGAGAAPPERLEKPPTGSALVVPAPPQVGQWAVTASGPDGPPVTLGFSVNVPAAESAFAPLEARDLDAMLGAGAYKVVENTRELAREVGKYRVGRELFPWIMALILLLITAENLLANTFYRERAAPEATRPAATPAHAAA